MAQNKSPFKQHLIELKNKLKPVALFFITVMILGYAVISRPILQYIKELVGIKVIAIHPYEIFVTQVELSFYLATILSIPVLATQIIRFFKPALTQEEYRITKKFIPLTFILSLSGLVIGFIFLTQMATGFLQGLAIGTGIENTWTISNIVSYIFKLSLATALIFNIPIVIILLNKLGVVKIEIFKQYRRHALIASVGLAALLSPPDFVSMIFLALPSYGFYELGLKTATLI